MKPIDENIFSYWRDIPGDYFIHPSDRITFEREGPTAHQLLLDCLPSPFFGPLRTASVVLLFLNPGFSITDRQRAHLKEEQDYYASQRDGYGKLPEGNEPVSAWCHKHIKQIGLTYEQSLNKVAFLNICPYHSAIFKDSHMLAALKSSRVMLDFAQFTLFPQAERGEKAVICLRSARVWGLEQGRQYGISLFSPNTLRNGIMRDGPLRNQVRSLAQNLCR